MKENNQSSINFRRIIAAFIELGILPFTPLLIFNLADQMNDINFTNLSFVYWFFILWYELCKDSLFDGQSVVKKILKIKVVDYESGVKCSVKQSILRNIILWLPGSFIVELVWIFSQPKGRRGGDYLANTVVVDSK